MNLLPPATVLTVAMLAGCANTYVEPTSGPIAKITFDMDRSPESWVTTYADPETCSGRIFLLHESKGVPTTATKTFAAGKAVTFSLGALMGTRPVTFGAGFTICNVSITFTPLAGVDYRASLSSTGALCRGAFRRTDGIALQTSEYRVRTWKRAHLESGSFCAPGDRLAPRA